MSETGDQSKSDLENGVPIPLNERLDVMFSNPMSETEYTTAVEGGKLTNKGHILFSSKEEFQAALKYAQSQFPWLTDEWVKETLEHEDEHLEEAKKRLENKGRFLYSLKAVQMKNGNLGISGGFHIDSYLPQEEFDEKHKRGILRAPKKKSASDKVKLGIDPISNLSNENGWQ